MVVTPGGPPGGPPTPGISLDTPPPTEIQRSGALRGSIPMVWLFSGSSKGGVPHGGSDRPSIGSVGSEGPKWSYRKSDPSHRGAPQARGGRRKVRGPLGLLILSPQPSDTHNSAVHWPPGQARPQKRTPKIRPDCLQVPGAMASPPRPSPGRQGAASTPNNSNDRYVLQWDCFGNKPAGRIGRNLLNNQINLTRASNPRDNFS